MKITETIKKTYDVYDCAKWEMSIGDTITKREVAGMKTSGFDKCFICKKEFKYNDFPYLALIRGYENSFICEECVKKVNPERVRRERSVCFEQRLTEWVDKGEEKYAVPKMDLRNNGHQKCCNKLAEYEDLEEQGLLLRLPCKVGDIVYSIVKIDDCCVDRCTVMSEKSCEDCRSNDVSYVVYQRIFNPDKDLGEFGKTVFLTQSEAEEKLRELEME